MAERTATSLVEAVQAIEHPLSPLHIKPDTEEPEPPDTYPWGF